MPDGPLNTEVKGNPDSCRAVAKWLADLSKALHGAGDSLYRARSESESIWQGQAGDAFRSSVDPKAKDTDELSQRAASLSQGLVAFAGNLDGVLHLMGQARSVAAQAGLVVTPTAIEPPGPGPAPAAAPTQPPAGSSPGATDEYRAAMRSYAAAFSDHENKVKAYNEANSTVDEARERERDAHRELGDVIKQKGFLQSYGVTVASAITSTGAALEGQVKVLNEKIGHYNAAIDATKGELTSAMSAAERQSNYTQLAALRKALYDTEQTAARTKIASYAMGGPIAHLSPGDIEKGAEKFTRIGKAGRIFPYFGTALTVYSAGKNIADGKPAAKEVEKAGGGLLASIGTGAAAGACIGGPVGAAVGAIGGAAVSYGLGKFIDWKGGPVEQFNRWAGLE